ncbi:hypothetical protein [Psychrobacillus sp. FJAT-21963]|uniref:hypothetical protein n=1 Tax=Psychrobacillus sp. FJAT-21963 TaxID=1712028 RepID=UPI0007005F4D|nr:hypothetical protein [Psychrobacillus sp. FJAT-21963]KQL37115.1 hypothetical protein AN959_03485 [Psychrobacillus sp. FJAT-21963]
MLLFVLPIYRVSAFEWEKEFENKMHAELSPLYDDNISLERGKERYRNRELYHYKYNDVVAWLELHLDFNKVKGRVFIADKKRFVRGFKPVFRDNYKASGIEISIINKSNEKIAEELIQSVMEYKEYAFKKRSLDITLLQGLAKHVDYKSILKERH